MKIIDKGDPRQAVHWWIGQEATCGNCGARAELEAHDNPSLAHSRPLLQDTAYVDCPNCGHAMKAVRST